MGSFGMFDGYDTHIEFNRFVNLDSIEWRIIDSLLNSTSVHAEDLWKMLKYPSEDCLFQEPLTRAEKIKMIYRDNGESSDKRVFMAPYTDDAWQEQASRLDVFVSRAIPRSHVLSAVNVTVEIIVHNKINNIYNNAEVDNPNSNPSEFDEEGGLLIPSKSRATAMLRDVLAELNGKMVAGVGQLQFNTQLSPYSTAQQYVWNNRAYIGYSAIFSTLMSGVSETPEVGY